MSILIPQEFNSFRDYHENGSIPKIDFLDWKSVRASILFETSGEACFKSNDRSSIVLAVHGSARHMTRMEGASDDLANHAGEICLIPADIEVHLRWENHAHLQETLMVDFDTDLFNLYAPELVTPSFLAGHLMPGGYARRPELEGLIRILTREVGSQSRRGRAFLDSAFQLLALEIATSVWSTPSKALLPETGRDPRVHRAIEFIEARFTEDISLLEISAASGLSLTQLKDTFRKHTGSTPYSYVINRRLSHAVTLLRRTDIPLVQVALEAGFADQQHMTRMFKARHNRTPGQIRNG